MANELKNKIIVITGGASGIGYAIADNFLGKGAKITILVDLNEEQGNKAVQTLDSKHGNNRAVYLKCDITKHLHETFAKILDTYKSIEVLVNSAGIFTGFEPRNEDINRKVIEINTTALILWSFKFWDYTRKDKGGNGGTIINIASVNGYKTTPTAPAYTASKFAVVGFTKGLGHEYHYNRSGVRVVAICPNFTDTPLLNNDILSKYEEEMKVFIKERHKKVVYQKPDAVGKAAIDVFERVDSGTVWLVEDGNPIVQVP